jgi:hypothetical protein
VSTRDIRTSHETAVCDVCGRTLLRGEHADTYLNGGARRSVCELCKARALHEGWVREGSVPAYEAAAGGSERRRSLLARLRPRRTPVERPPQAGSPEREGGIRLTPPAAGANGATPRPAADPAAARRRSAAAGERALGQSRHVRAVPTSAGQRAVAAIELFNRSEHCRTVAGVARSLGAPAVHVAPDAAHPSLVAIVVAWELCWYRYEVDLSEVGPGVRVAGQGYELDELSASERTPNALADEHGTLSVTPRVQ